MAIFNENYSDYKETTENNIRYRVVTYTDTEVGEMSQFAFELFERPYFYGLIGKKRWCYRFRCGSFDDGFSFSKFLSNTEKGKWEWNGDGFKKIK